MLQEDGREVGRSCPLYPSINDHAYCTGVVSRNWPGQCPGEWAGTHTTVRMGKLYTRLLGLGFN
jgi:hypothetical protein